MTINKDFLESLRDGFNHITNISDPELVKTLREEGISIDSEGYYSFLFGEHKEYELAVEPLNTEGQYYIALYKNRVLLTVKLPVWIEQKK